MGQTPTGLDAAAWLGLAAAPAFAIAAGLTAAHGGAMPGMICTGGQQAAWLEGMAPMYLLMSAVHAGPWLRLIGRRGRRAA